MSKTNIQEKDSLIFENNYIVNLFQILITVWKNKLILITIVFFFNCLLKL